MTFQLCLGSTGGGDGYIAATATISVMRLLRDRLTADGLYRPRWPFTGVKGDNFVDPSALVRGVDLHAEAVAQAFRAVETARSAYRDLVENVFGFELADELVEVSVKKVELTWDAPTPAAPGCCGIFWPAWRDAMPNPSFEDKDDPEKPRLRAKFQLGEAAKLYTKHNELERFEAEIDGKAAAKRLGHSIRLSSPEEFAQDLEGLARRPYSSLLAAQANLVWDRRKDLAWVVGQLAKSGGEKIELIARAFLNGEPFHHVGRSHERELARLKAKGLVRRVGRGLWRPDGAMQRALRRYHYARSLGAA